MSTISSNTLFHFTNGAEKIINIIKNGFMPRFCLEGFGPEIFIGGEDNIEQAVPMTCFCDLPLSRIETHLEFYGSYGIGLSKEWGQENGLTPITYIHSKSTQVKYLRQLGTTAFEVFNKMTDKVPIEKNPLVALFELAGFFKPYSGQMWRINKYVEARFYDEREWRYVPFINSRELQYRLNKEEFLNDIKRASANDLIGEKFALKFSASDVKYLIVQKEQEMVALSDALDMMQGIYSLQDIKILKTKIISSEQIREDF